jgi:hypothetical protein
MFWVGYIDRFLFLFASTILIGITHDPHELLNNGRQTQKLVYWMSGREARCDVLKAIKVQ